MRMVVFVVLGLAVISGCATAPSKYDDYYVVYNLPPNPNAVSSICQKDNDLYLVVQEFSGFSTTYSDRRLTNTPDANETDVRVWNAGVVTYFSNDGGGGHWYMQPLGGDDTNKKEISPEELMKMSAQKSWTE